MGKDKNSLIILPSLESNQILLTLNIWEGRFLWLLNMVWNKQVWYLLQSQAALEFKIESEVSRYLFLGMDGYESCCVPGQTSFPLECMQLGRLELNHRALQTDQGQWVDFQGMDEQVFFQGWQDCFNHGWEDWGQLTWTSQNLLLDEFSGLVIQGTWW